MWPAWLLDLKQIMNHVQVSVMISNQDKDFLSYKSDLNISEGERIGGYGLGGELGDRVIHVHVM